MAKQRINKRSIAAKKRLAKKKKKNEILNPNDLGKIGSILKIRLPEEYKEPDFKKLMNDISASSTSLEQLYKQLNDTICEAIAKIRGMI